MQLLSTIPYFETGAAGDLEQREILANLLDVTNEEGDLLQIMEMTGRFVPTKNKEFFNYTDGYLYASAAVDGASQTISAGSEGTLVLDDTSRVRAGEVIMFADGGLGYVRSVDSGTDLTVYAIDAIAPANGEVVTFPTNGIEEGGEGSLQPDTDLTKRSNQVQIFETSKSVSDLHKAGKTVLKMPNGKYAYFYKLENDVYKKHRLDIGNAFIVGKKDSFSRLDSGNDRKVHLTRGLNSYIVDMGGVTHDTAGGDGTMTKADFKNFCRKLDLARSPRSGFLWTGGEINAVIDDLFDTLMDQGNINYNIFGKGDGKQKKVELGMNAFTVYNRTFYKNFLSALDHPKVTATTAAKWPDYAYYVPTDKVKSHDGEMVDRIRGRYLEIDGINSRWHPKYLGGLAPTPTERQNKFTIAITSWEGLEIVGTEQLGRLNLTQA